MREYVQETIFYRFNLEDTIRDLRRQNANIILIQRLQDVGWNALRDLDVAFISAIIDDDDNLIVCESNYEPIDLNNEEVEPEEMLDRFSVETLDRLGLVQNADSKTVHKYITEYELSDQFDLDNVVLELLNDGHSFQEVVQAARDLDYID